MLSLEAQRPGREAEHLPPSSAKPDERSYTLSPLPAFMTCGGTNSIEYDCVSDDTAVAEHCFVLFNRVTRAGVSVAHGWYTGAT